ncbi:MAG: 50S ribosomal protein L11 methyltransferase [Candidatus Eutrophobiaceae bacterium]
MGWLTLEFTIDAKTADSVGTLLECFDAQSVNFAAASPEQIIDAPDRSCPKEEALLWEKTRISALLPLDCDIDILLGCLRNCVGDSCIENYHIGFLEDRDWVSECQQAFQPLVFDDHLQIVPSWHLQKARADHPEHLLLKLDPGLAFGTGNHATTHMCLLWLVEHRAWLAGKRGIDYGCGSGILALSASLLGAKSMQACDLDPQALTACAQNAKENGLKGISILPAPEDPVAPPGDLQVADLLIANILLQPLTALARRFATLLAPGGRIVLSGILHSQAVDCVTAYAPWFKFKPPTFKNEWALLSGTKKA